MTIDKRTELLYSYSGKWIATNSNREKIFASGSTIKELDKKLEKSKLKEKDLKNIIISKVPPVNATVSP